MDTVSSSESEPSSVEGSSIVIVDGIETNLPTSESHPMTEAVFEEVE